MPSPKNSVALQEAVIKKRLCCTSSASLLLSSQAGNEYPLITAAFSLEEDAAGSAQAQLVRLFNFGVEVLPN